jgi:hypothetical protein
MTLYGTVQDADEEPKRTCRQPVTMDPRTWTKDLTGYFMFLLIASTIGPLLFGFHLVTHPLPLFSQHCLC